VFAGALRALWASSAFAAYNCRDLLDQLVRLELRGEFVRDISDQSDRSVARAGKKYRAFEFRLQSVRDCLEKFSICIRYFRDGKVFSSMRSRQFAGDLSSPALDLGLRRLGCLLSPIMHFGIYFFEVRQSRVDLFQDLGCRCIILESRQRSDVWFLACERPKLLLLSRRLLRRPYPRCIASDRFNAPSSRRNGFLFHNTKRPDLARRSHVRAAAELHRITIQLARRSADLQDANCVAVFLAEKLNNVLPLFRIGEWNFSPRNRRAIGNLFVHQFFNVPLLLRRERRTRKIEC